ncbi:hypothetical protein [Mucilaginibacter flavidus]|uniref:hypothetical protein n=1 Tax=Mucilaginibacter flavidus TaxID=2949309 RepID=UPI002093B4AF|nr:hypothetical protein [Mucilaginibacter flavidus]MCO5946533.1 hypothetical protein [Mucilaginibacter flavidus]
MQSKIITQLKIVVTQFFCIIGLAPGLCYGQLDLSTNYFKIHIDKKGFITSMKKGGITPGREFSPTDKPSPLLCLYSSKKDKYYLPQSARYNFAKRELLLTYSNGSKASVLIKAVNKKYITLTLKSLSPRNDIDDIQWGPFHTNITNLFGDIIGVARDTSEAVNFSIGALALNDATTGGKANVAGDFSPCQYIIHSPDVSRFPLPAGLHEGEMFTLGGNGINDVAFFSHPEEYYRILNGNTAFIDSKGQISLAYHAVDRRVEKMIYFSLMPLMPANYPVHQKVQAIPDLDLIGSSIALWGAPDDLALNVLENIVVNEKLPYPKVNGKWIKKPARYIPDVAWYGNYDSCLVYTKRLGFKAIQAEGLGEFYPNRANHGNIDWKIPFSTGKTTIKEFTDQTNKRGILFGLHTLNNFLQSNVSSDVSPVPNDSLCVLLKTKLSNNITANDTNIIVDNEQYLNEYGGWEGHPTNIIKIGNELIYYKGITATKPYTLQNVKRGFWKTNAIAHNSGDALYKLQTNCYGGLVPDIFLQDKLADYYAQLSKVNGMDYIDLDGEEGFLYQGHGNYAFKRFFKRFFEQSAKLGVSYQRVMGATIAEGGWHYQSVLNVGGGENMYLIKDRKWAIEGKDIRNICFSNFLPATFGITAPLRPNSTVQEWENLQAISVGVGVTYMMNLSEKSVESCLQKNLIFRAIKIWENARAANSFTYTVKKILADSARQFHLEEIDTNTWKLFELKNGKNIYLKTLHRDIQNGY